MPASAQSITDRFKGLFGGKSDEEPAANTPAVPEDTGDLTCPPVTVRAGAATYAVAAPGKQPVGNDLRFQATISKMARECTVNGGVITARIGIQGRVIAGPAGAPPPFHPKLWVICLGGALGVVILRFAAAMFIKLLDRFPRFELTAYLLVIVIGVKLLADWGCNSDWSFNEPKWAAEKLGGWKQSFEEFENRRQHWAIGYEKWLEENWIITIKPHAEPEGPLHQVPHLLDFHNIRRPESIAFWLLMVISFCTGFIPPRKRPGGGAPARRSSPPATE
jgi:hypothetical protein